MGYNGLIERLNEWNENCISWLCANDVLTCDDLCGTGDCIVVQAVTAITDLLARAAAAEARVRELETSFRTEKCENGPECAELGRARKRAEAAEARAEKAERERDELFRILNDVCQDVRAKSADEYVCGLCEYDGAHIGESGDWVNECPGFEKDDCFCIKKSMREKFGQKEE